MAPWWVPWTYGARRRGPHEVHPMDTPADRLTAIVAELPIPPMARPIANVYVAGLASVPPWQLAETLDRVAALLSWAAHGGERP